MVKSKADSKTKREPGEPIGELVRSPKEEYVTAAQVLDSLIAEIIPEEECSHD